MTNVQQLCFPKHSLTKSEVYIPTQAPSLGLFPTCNRHTGWSKRVCTWWLQHRKLQVMFKVPPTNLQTIIDTRLTLTPSVIHNSNYVFMVNDWNCLKHLCMFWTVIIRCTETFLSPCINTNTRRFGARLCFHLRQTAPNLLDPLDQAKWLRVSWSKGYNRLGASSLKTETQPASET
jgi:hypothetical protein